MESKINTIPFSHLKKVVEAIERDHGGNPENLDDVQISFEFLIGSCFPLAFQNVQEALKKAHMDGYRQCLEEHKEEINNET